ncbi:FecCD family ABC transporter permease [Alicyclobacillus sendaiensis]|uniref:FecCD family ABC transporter permease n=1 Tax=Alicyclobacillus sendaiensis TaxID=192387 RepID=UPI0026F42F31|nr:iron ABC transporter permease [Alicyclobacillus sendaiensis]
MSVVRSYFITVTASVLFLAVSLCIAMMAGASPIGVRGVLDALFGHRTDTGSLAIISLRLPRVVAGAMVGASLAVSGMIMQGITKNPLAEPGLFGVSAGANLALSLSMAFGANYADQVAPFVCFFGALAGIAVVTAVGSLRSVQFSPLRMALAGASVSVFCNAVAQGIEFKSNLALGITAWLEGGLSGIQWGSVLVACPWMAVGLALALALATELTVQRLDMDVAQSLGQRTLLIRLSLYAVVALLASASVYLAGNITFFGLLVPHVVRAIAGGEDKKSMPIAMLLGAGLMMLADAFARFAIRPYELPLPAVLAVAGLPFFVTAVRKMR